MKKKLLMNVWIMLALFTCVGISSCSDNDEDGTKGHQVLRLVDKSGNPIGGISGGDCNLTGSAENLTLRVMSDLDWEITISEGNEWFKADITKGSGSKEISFTSPRSSIYVCTISNKIKSHAVLRGFFFSSDVI